MDLGDCIQSPSVSLTFPKCKMDVLMTIPRTCCTNFPLHGYSRDSKTQGSFQISSLCFQCLGRQTIYFFWLPLWWETTISNYILYLCPCGCPQVAKDLLHLFSSVLQGRDIIGLAETGSGKTGAFALPIVQVCNSCWMISCNALVIGQTDLSFLFVCFNHCICRETSGIRQPLIHSSEKHLTDLDWGCNHPK